MRRPGKRTLGKKTSRRTRSTTTACLTRHQQTRRPMCCLRLPAEVDVPAFHHRLAGSATRVAPGAWFGEDDHVVRVGFGHLDEADFATALGHVAEALAAVTGTAS